MHTKIFTKKIMLPRMHKNTKQFHKKICSQIKLRGIFQRGENEIKCGWHTWKTKA